MESYLNILERNLTANDQRLLKEIYAPKVVGIPPEDSRRSLMVMPDGEIRCYGITNKKNPYNHEDGDIIYLSSRDCGLSWKKIYSSAPDVLGACVKVPGKQRYITIKSRKQAGKEGTYGFVSEIGPEDSNPKAIKILDRICGCMFQPVQISGGRWICTMEWVDEHTVEGKYLRDYHPVVMYSDDDGDSWKTIFLDSVPRFEVVWPHKGPRWENNGGEPSMAELSDGRLMMLIRTSQNYFYVSYSNDRGENWTKPMPSPFHGTLTTPFLLRLQDSRVIAFWNNTQPLAEMDKTRYWPPIGKEGINGTWEDVFTNRDANHAAITEDGGKSWIGFRELALNEVRNAADFRTTGSMLSSADKSVHQFQAMELPYGKILVSYGQNESSRRLAIFDVNWLYETVREERFFEGLKNLSTHLYVKGICETHYGEGYPGHCAWNRTNGALLVPDPAGTYGEALQINRVQDERLVSELQGAVWNFPAMKRGTVSMELRVEGAGLRVSLTDRWFNAADEFIDYYAAISFRADDACVDSGKWMLLSIVFDTTTGWAEVFCDEKKLYRISMREEAPNGFSYLHLQTLAETADPKGSYIRRLSAKADK